MTDAVRPVVRPTSSGPHSYLRPEAAPVIGARAVIHYVRGGKDSPPLADPDRDGIPDAVERVSRAADQALAFYASPSFNGVPFPGFRSPPCDSAGPNDLPDIYLKDIGSYGVAYPPTVAEGGAFVVVSSRLDRSDISGGYEFTTRHELFHLIQFAYRPDGRIPAWIAEGTASTMAFLGDPRDNDVLLAEVDRWRKTPDRSLYDEQVSGCDRCYGGVLWWASPTSRVTMAALLERLAAVPPELIGNGAEALRATFAEHYRALRDEFAPIADVALYHEFRWVSEASFLVLRGRPPARRTINLGKRSVVHKDLLRGLSTHYIRVQPPAWMRSLEVRLLTSGSGAPQFELLLGIEDDHCQAVVEQPLALTNGVIAPQPVVRINVRDGKSQPTVLLVSSASLSSKSYELRVNASPQRRSQLGDVSPVCGVEQTRQRARS